MESVLRFGKNETGRDFVVGDIHGCYGLFMDLLAKAEFNPEKDRCFSVGDLVDRGPQCLEVVRLLNNPWFIAVKGNHEDMLICGFAFGSSVNIHIANGGGWFYDIEDERVRLEIAEVLNDLPVAIELDTEIGKIGIVHAECPTQSWDDFVRIISKESSESDHQKEMAMWARRKVSGKDASSIKGVTMVVSGHTILRDWSQVGNHMFIDTGAFNFGKLTMWCPTTQEIFQVTQ